MKPENLVGVKFKALGHDLAYTIANMYMEDYTYKYTIAWGDDIEICSTSYAYKDVMLLLTEGRWKIVDNTQIEPEQSAVSMLQEAAECIGDRAAERDTESERSMAACVRAFNGMYETELTEEQGWQFMVLLKMARTKGGKYRRDDYVDEAAYAALAGECR